MSVEVVYVEAMDQQTVLHIIYCMLSVQQANLSECEGRKASTMIPFLCLRLYHSMGLLRNAPYGCTITMYNLYQGKVGIAAMHEIFQNH